MERKNITNLQLSEAEVKKAIAYYLEQRECLGVHPRDIRIEILVNELTTLWDHQKRKADDFCGAICLPCEYTAYDLEAAKAIGIQAALKLVQAHVSHTVEQSRLLRICE